MDIDMSLYHHLLEQAADQGEHMDDLACAEWAGHQLEQMIVSGFYEGQYPEFQQGSPVHELQEIVTAEEVAKYVAKIRELYEVQGQQLKELTAQVQMLSEQVDIQLVVGACPLPAGDRPWDDMENAANFVAAQMVSHYCNPLDSPYAWSSEEQEDEAAADYLNGRKWTESELQEFNRVVISHLIRAFAHDNRSRLEVVDFYRERETEK
jgi:hypothetical protein